MGRHTLNEGILYSDVKNLLLISHIVLSYVLLLNKRWSCVLHLGGNGD